MSWDTLPKTGLFYVLLTSKGGNTAFSSPSPPCNVVLMFELPIENDKHLEWRDQGRGGDCFVLRSYPIWVQCLDNFIADCRSGTEKWCLTTVIDTKQKVTGLRSLIHLYVIIHKGFLSLLIHTNILSCYLPKGAFQEQWLYYIIYNN